MDALFYKMKADYLRNIYECLSGDNGLLQVFDTVQNFEKIDDNKEHVNNSEQITTCIKCKTEPSNESMND